MTAKIWTNGDSIIRMSRKHYGKRRNCSSRAISPFPIMFSKAVCCSCVKTSIYGVKGKVFPKRQIVDSSKLKEFADDNFELNENGRKISKMSRKHLGKRRNCSLRAISPFLTLFSKDLYGRHAETRACFGRVKSNISCLVKS